MARYGQHADRCKDALVSEVWLLIRTCDRTQATLVRNLAAHHLAALDGFPDERRKGVFRDDELILAILEADLAKREGMGEALKTIADYKRWRRLGSPSASTICRAFGGWPQAMKAAHANLVKGSNRHLMIREGVSQTGAKRNKVTKHDCVVAFADCMEAQIGLRPSEEQYKTWALNEARHHPGVNTVRRLLGDWYTAADLGAAFIRENPSRYPVSSRMWTVVDGLNRASNGSADGAQ